MSPCREMSQDVVGMSSGCREMLRRCRENVARCHQMSPNINFTSHFIKRDDMTTDPHEAGGLVRVPLGAVRGLAHPYAIDLRAWQPRCAPSRFPAPRFDGPKCLPSRFSSVASRFSELAGLFSAVAGRCKPLCTPFLGSIPPQTPPFRLLRLNPVVFPDLYILLHRDFTQVRAKFTQICA